VAPQMPIKTVTTKPTRPKGTRAGRPGLSTLLAALALVLWVGVAVTATSCMSDGSRGTLAVEQCATAPTLGTSQSFAVLGAQTVTNTGPTVVSGNLGVFPGTAVTGFDPGGPGVVIGGSIHAGDAVADQARNDAIAAYNALAGEACLAGRDLTDQDLGGLTLTPGTYCFSSSAQLTGTLTLDALEDPAATFVFQIGSTLTTASSSAVIMTNGGNPCNVFWQVGSSATVGTDTDLIGNIFALASVTLTTDATLAGRAIALEGSVTLDSNTVGAPVCEVAEGGGSGDGGVDEAENDAGGGPDDEQHLDWDCNGICVDWNTDEQNCGSCGNWCAEGLTCVNGECL